MKRVALIVLLSIPAAMAVDKDKGRFVPGPASSYPQHLTQEGITMAAVPYITEEQAKELKREYKVGKFPFAANGRAKAMDETEGIVKILADGQTDRVLGVHIIGEGAAELIHIGQAVLSFGGKIDYFVDTVFNYPTLAECYKVAAFDGINRLGIFEAERTEIPLNLSA